MTKDIHPMLKPGASDYAEKALRSITSAVDVVAPGVGSVFGELIGAIIPNTRSQRFEEFLTRLARRISMTERKLDALIDGLGPEQIALFEDGARGAVRATTPARIDRFARMVARGLTADEIEAERVRVLVALLEQLSESDLLYLDGFVGRMGPDPRGRSSCGRSLDFGPGFEDLSSVEQMKVARDVRARQREVDAIEEYRLTKLVNLNLLLQPVLLVPGRPQLGGGMGLPQMAKDRVSLTVLGHLILVRAGLGQETWEDVMLRESEDVSLPA